MALLDDTHRQHHTDLPVSPPPYGARAAGVPAATAPATADAEASDAAHRLLCAKALREFIHEDLLCPASDPSTADAWSVTFNWSVRYDFQASVYELRHFEVQPDSIRRVANGVESDPNIRQLIEDAHTDLNMGKRQLGHYLAELAATWSVRTSHLSSQAPTADDLADADFQRIEQSMAEGHPGFVANSGRRGFSTIDVARYAPEAGAAIHPEWVAVRQDCGDTAWDANCINTFDDIVPAHIRATWAHLAAVHGVDSAAYFLMPVHPWQWQNHIVPMFSPDLATKQLVHVGPDPHAHQAQQSIRTLYNTDVPGAPYVKMSLAMYNMGFMRGMSPRYALSAPAITSWLHDQVAADTELVTRRFHFLREFCAAGYTGDVFHRLSPGSPYTKMMAAMWRENPYSYCSEADEPCTMAALLHRDRFGNSLCSSIIAKSGLTADDWLALFADKYISPLVYLLAVKRMAFMPHGENIIMVLRDGVPHGMLLKDIAEEVVCAHPDIDVPEEFSRIKMSLTDEDLAECFHSDMIDGFLRHLAALLDDVGTLPQRRFWAIIHDTVMALQRRYTEVSALRLHRRNFTVSCLNRLQLRDPEHMVDLTDPAGSLIRAAAVPNPIRHRL